MGITPSPVPWTRVTRILLSCIVCRESSNLSCTEQTHTETKSKKNRKFPIYLFLSVDCYTIRDQTASRMRKEFETLLLCTAPASFGFRAVLAHLSPPPLLISQPRKRESLGDRVIGVFSYEETPQPNEDIKNEKRRKGERSPATDLSEKTPFILAGIRFQVDALLSF